MAFTNPQSPDASGTPNSYTAVSGSRATSNVGSSAAKREVDEAMITFEPYQTPLLTELLSNKARRKPTGNQKFEWTTSSLLPRTDTVTLTGGAASEDNISVGDSTLYQVGTKFVVDATGQVCIVDSIASSQIDVTRVGAGNITAGTSTTVHFLGESFEQGSSSATAKSANKEFPYNYVERFKVAVAETTSQQATVEYGPNDWNRNKMDRMAEFKMALERNLLHGIRSSATGYQNGSFTQFFSGGIFDSTANFIPAHYGYAGATPTETYFFETFCKGFFSKGTARKRLYVGANLKIAISNYSKVKQQTKQEEKEYGIVVRKIDSDFGVMEIAWHPMLDGSVFTKLGTGIDLGRDFLKYRYLAGNGKSHDVNFYDYPHFEESDQRKGEWKCEIGWELQNGENNAILEPA